MKRSCFTHGCLPIIALLIIAFYLRFGTQLGTSIAANAFLFSVVLTAIICAIIYNYFFGESAKKEAEELIAKVKNERAWIENTSGKEYDEPLFAEYITGFDNSEKSNFKVGYFAIENAFIFYANDNSQWFQFELPRDGIKSYEITDHTQFTKKFSLGALIVMGPYGISQQDTEKHEIYYLRIDCVKGDGISLAIVFRSNSTAEFERFISLIRPFRVRLNAEEKKCPYCAEIIKLEAIKCRFCGSELKGK